MPFPRRRFARFLLPRLLLALLGAGGVAGEQARGSADPGPVVAAAAPPAARVTVMDLSGFSAPLPAARIPAPAGWTLRGGVHWDHGAGCLAHMVWEAWSLRSPDGRQRIEALPGAGWVVGDLKPVNEPCPQAPPRNAREYLTALAQAQLPQAREAGFTAREDLAAQALAEAGPASEDEEITASGGSLLLAWTQDDVPMRARLDAVVVVTARGSWHHAQASGVLLYRAPRADFAPELLEQLRAGVARDPVWRVLAQRQVAANLARWHERYGPARADAVPAEEEIGPASDVLRARRPALFAPFIIRGVGTWAEDLALRIDTRLPAFWHGEVGVAPGCAHTACLRWWGESADGAERVEILPARLLPGAGGEAFLRVAQAWRDEIFPVAAELEETLPVRGASATGLAAEYVARRRVDGRMLEQRLVLRVGPAPGPLRAGAPRSRPGAPTQAVYARVVTTLAGRAPAWDPRPDVQLRITPPDTDVIWSDCAQRARQIGNMSYIGAGEDSRAAWDACVRAMAQRRALRSGLPQAPTAGERAGRFQAGSASHARRVAAVMRDG